MRVISTCGPVGQQLARIVIFTLFAAKAWRLTQINLLFAQILQLRLQLGIALGQVACDIVIHSQRLTQYEHIADGRNQGTQ